MCGQESSGLGGAVGRRGARATVGDPLLEPRAMPAEHSAQADRTRYRAAIDQAVDCLGRTGKHVGHVVGGEHDGGRGGAACAWLVLRPVAVGVATPESGAGVYCSHPSESFHRAWGFKGTPTTPREAKGQAGRGGDQRTPRSPQWPTWADTGDVGIGRVGCQTVVGMPRVPRILAARRRFRYARWRQAERQYRA